MIAWLALVLAVGLWVGVQLGTRKIGFTLDEAQAELEACRELKGRIEAHAWAVVSGQKHIEVAAVCLCHAMEQMGHDEALSAVVDRANAIYRPKGDT